MPVIDIPIDGYALALGTLAMFGGGLIKGIIGLGLPLIAIPILATMMPIPTAIALLCFPILVSNTIQVRQAQGFRRTIHRFWPLLTTLVIGMLIGAQLLVQLDEDLLSLILGLILVGFATLNIVSPDISLPPGREKPIGAVIGFVAGIIGGLSSFFGTPIVMFMVALRLDRDTLVGAISIVYATGSVPLYGALAWYGILGPWEALISLAAIAPSLLGLFLGQQVRKRVPQEKFRLLILGMLIVIGLKFIWSSF
jgi:uncharacterized membrane protein YfcA